MSETKIDAAREELLGDTAAPATAGAIAGAASRQTSDSWTAAASSDALPPAPMRSRRSRGLALEKRPNACTTLHSTLGWNLKAAAPSPTGTTLLSLVMVMVEPGERTCVGRAELEGESSRRGRPRDARISYYECRLVPGVGSHPHPRRGTPDFKSPLSISACLGRSEFFLLILSIRPSRRRRHLGLSRRVSLPPCCHPGRALTWRQSFLTSPATGIDLVCRSGPLGSQDESKIPGPPLAECI